MYNSLEPDLRSLWEHTVKTNNPNDWVSDMRSTLLDLISETSPENRVCILLSGGSDSTVVGLSSHTLGKKVTSLSFELDGYPNKDCEQSWITSEKIGWDFHKVIVPTERPSQWFVDLIKTYGCKKKTEVECLYPIIFLCKKIKELGFDKVLTGFESPLPDGRSSEIHSRRDIKDYWKTVSDHQPTGTIRCLEYLRREGVEPITPLSHPSVLKVLSNLSYDQIHKPYHKSPWKLPFKDLFEKVGRLNGKNVPLQVGSGVEKFFSSIIEDPFINYKSYNKGNQKLILSSLVKLWTKTGYVSYTMEDVNRESNKELFSVISTFGGGGGSSTGYRLSGGKILLVNEFIPEGIRTYKSNYPDTPIDPRDIRKITGSGYGRKGVLDWLESYNIRPDQVDIFDGSPPCSTFSRSRGKRDDSKVLEKNVVYSDTTQDRIGMLLHDYSYLVNCIQPKVFVMENVPDFQNHDIFTHCKNRMRKWGYKMNHKILVSSHYGVPQQRRRLILIGVRPDVCEKVGIETDDDILDIFPIGTTFEPNIRDGLKDVVLNKEEINYLKDKTRLGSSYEIIKHLKKDQPKRQGPKSLDPDWTGDFSTVRESWERPSSTLTSTGCSVSRGGSIHPSEDRGFTINEIKRLMSLPDDFKLTGSRSQKGERCGRMVTPLLMKEVSKSIYNKVLKPYKL